MVMSSPSIKISIRMRISTKKKRIRDDKIFPKEEAYAGGLLKMMLREISFKNEYRGSRLGGTELGHGSSMS